MTGNNRKVLYVGGFKLPDLNAAAHRVVNLGKAFSALSYNVYYMHCGNIIKQSELDEVEHIGLSRIARFKKLLGLDAIAGIRKLKPNYVVLYNYWSVSFAFVFLYCKLNKVKVISDCTEWYGVIGYRGVKKLAKFIDTEVRMRVLNKLCFKVISISTYLHSYYGHKSVLIPPLVDVDEAKWNVKAGSEFVNPKYFNILYSGNVGYGKDSLYGLIEKVIEYNKSGKRKIRVIIAGTTRLEFETSKFNYLPKGEEQAVVFTGRLTHDEVLMLNQACDILYFYRPAIKANKAGFPTKFVEAYTLDLPIITNDVSDVSKYLQIESKGRLIESPEKLNLEEIVGVYSCRDHGLDLSFHFKNHLVSVKQLFH
ncbi:glycosyltransferase [Idiomarina sp. 29L]|uniref:glycosyltransferase n=1 Tax=Idiomarina sp. 29L TaxID=2508877 RepID=UPI00101092D1|nr:glycosyltransferase [Idiomarina sp. 29L]RXS43022.1 glycosyltransferase [Idiomarina sp. 29L]